jgi:hypothetical protein
MAERAAAAAERAKRNLPAIPPPAESPIMRKIPDLTTDWERWFPGVVMPEVRIAREKAEAEARAAAEREE